MLLFVFVFFAVSEFCLRLPTSPAILARLCRIAGMDDDLEQVSGVTGDGNPMRSWGLCSVVDAVMGACHVRLMFRMQVLRRSRISLACTVVCDKPASFAVAPPAIFASL